MEALRYLRSTPSSLQRAARQPVPRPAYQAFRSYTKSSKAAGIVNFRRLAQAQTKTQAQPEGQPATTKEFGYTRKDVMIITFGLIALGYAMYYGLQAMGMEPGYAGNWVQLTIFLGICIGWVSTYLYRVATKQMTYVKQLEQYEQAVMKKRLEEMTEDELSGLLDETEEEKKRRAARRQQQ